MWGFSSKGAGSLAGGQAVLGSEIQYLVGLGWVVGWGPSLDRTGTGLEKNGFSGFGS
jgi:hypothetical protein